MNMRSFINGVFADIPDFMGECAEGEDWEDWIKRCGYTGMQFDIGEEFGDVHAIVRHHLDFDKSEYPYLIEVSISDDTTFFVGIQHPADLLEFYKYLLPILEYAHKRDELEEEDSHARNHKFAQFSDCIYCRRERKRE